MEEKGNIENNEVEEDDISNEEKEDYMIEDAEENCDNKEFMMKALDDGFAWVVAYASDTLHADKELMLKGVQADGQLLYYASKELRDNKEVVLSAVKNKWRILKYASENMRNDIDVACKALEQSKDAIMYIGDEIKDREEIQALLNKE